MNLDFQTIKKHFDIKQIFQPRLYEILKGRHYSKSIFKNDLAAGLITGIVAIPLGIAFSSAAGLSPEKGLVTCIIAAFVVALLGGSNVQIAGPTGAFIVIIDGIVRDFGPTGLIIATVMAGCILILIGILRLGTYIKFIPYPITVGLTSGIALIIFSYQIKDFFGLTITESLPTDFLGKWTFYFSNINTANIWSIIIGVATILTVVIWPKISKRIPVFLVAIVLITLLNLVLKHFWGISVETVGSKFPELTGNSPLSNPATPAINIETIRHLIQPAFTIAMLSAIQSMLSAMVSDGAIGKKHHSNTEFIAQGAANIVVPFFGGIPSAGAIARTMANVNNGGKTPMAAIIHSIFLLIVLLFMMPLAAHIPLACLAGILIVVSYNMSGWRSFKALFKNSHSDIVVLLVTFFLTILFDLNIAIEIGLLMAVLLFLRRVMETSKISVLNDVMNSENPEDTRAEILDISKDVEVYEIDGPFFFGMANIFDEKDARIAKNKVKVRIIRMRKVPFIDSTGLHNLNNLRERSKKEKIQLVLSGVTPSVFDTLKKSGFADELGEEFICDHISKAVEKAKKILNENKH